MITGTDAPISASAPPAHAVLQMKAVVPDRALEFAHLLQESHFAMGRDLNLPQTYDEICETHGFPALDTQAIVGATENEPLVAVSFAKTAQMGCDPSRP
jgi:protein-disulfide isomerase-like protein with CxxC motif